MTAERLLALDDFDDIPVDEPHPAEIEPNPFHEEPAAGPDIDFGPEAPGSYVPPIADLPTVERAVERAVDGAAFVLNESTSVPAIWGNGEDVLWASGEAVMLYGPDGVGKTTLQQQLIRARLGLSDTFLGLPVAPAERRVLFIAADRPRQAARSFRRMVDDRDEDEMAVLRDRLIVWKGPLPFDMTKEAGDLAKFAHHYGADDIFIDSQKDVALDLSKDEVGSRVNLAYQEVIAEGIEICVNHHPRKATDTNRKPNKIADVYGSRWLTAGMGSIVCVWGEAGDLVVELSHLKQPAATVGPFVVIHDHVRGISTVSEHTDLEVVLSNAHDGLIVAEAARLIAKKADPSPNEVEKARRRLNGLVAAGKAERRDDPDGVARYFIRHEPA